MKVTLMGLFLVALVLATASQAIAGIGYGILWHNVTTGRFGVWQVSDHGSVFSAYDLTVDNPPWDSNPIYDEQRVPNTLHTYYYFCGANVLDPVTHKPYDPVGCSNTSTYSITELFPQRAGGFDFLYYNYLQGGISPQFADFTGKVTIPGHPLRNWNGTAAECDAASGCSADWKMVGTGTFDQSGGAPSILWYNARAGQLRVWKISTLDLRTVIDKVDWSACGGSCAAYGTPVGAADFNGDGIIDILWLTGDGRLTVFLQNGSGGYRAQAIPRSIPIGFSLVGVRRELYSTEVRLVFYNPFSGVLQQWIVDTYTSPYSIKVDTLTWNCNGCFPDWRPVGLVPIR